MKSSTPYSAVLWAVLAIGFGGGLAHADEPQRLRVLSYNIHHGEGRDGKLDLERIAKIIRSAEPDVVALQEVDQGVLRSDRVDQPAELSRLTEMQVAFSKNIDHEGGAYGNAVLSKLPMSVVENIKLPSIEGSPEVRREQRGALVVEVQGVSGEKFLFAATHLDHRRPDDERLASAQLLNDRFASLYHEQAAVLAGDLNATPDGGVLERFSQAWQKAGDKPISTIAAVEHRKQIDYVLVRPAHRWRVVEVSALDEPVASDHRPVLAILELLSPEP